MDAVVIASESMSRELFYVAASRGREHLTVITSDKARLEEAVGRSGARLSASELVRTIHARLAEGFTLDASRGFERGIRAVAEGRRQSVGFEEDSHGHAVPAPVHQQAIQHTASHEREAPPQKIERGQGYGISR
jgi:hypothetical protein